MSDLTLGDLLRQDAVSNLDTRAAIEYIDLKLIDPDPRNFYKLSKLDDLVQNIELLGLQQPLLVRAHPEKPERVIVVSGHRRRAALLRLVKEGHDKFKQVPCIRQRNPGSAAMQELSLIYANSATRTLTSGEIAKQVEKVTYLLYVLQGEGMKFPGKMRDHVAQACNISASKVARINAIKANLIPEYYEQYQQDKLQESAAYTMSRFPEDFQRRLMKAVPKIEQGTYLEGVLKRYQSGWRWEPEQQCPDGAPCKRGDAFLRHDVACSEWNHCGGQKCCMTCTAFMSPYAACDRACSKAKAAKKDKKDAEKAAEETRRAKELKKTQQIVAARAARLVKPADAAGLDDKARFSFNQYGTSWTVKKLRAFAAGDFGNEQCYSSDLDPNMISNIPKVAQLFKCSADYILGLTDEPHPIPQSTEQLAGTKYLVGWYPNEVHPKDGQAIVFIDQDGVADNDVYQAGVLKHGSAYGIAWDDVVLWTPEPEYPAQELDLSCLRSGLDTAGGDGPVGQLVFSGWMPGGTHPATPCDAAVVFDLDGKHVKRLCRWNGRGFTFPTSDAEVAMKPIKWMALPPDEEDT